MERARGVARERGSGTIEAEDLPLAVADLPGGAAREPLIEAGLDREGLLEALERALRVAAARGDRAIGPGHVVLGVLRAEPGTVPRALAAAGVDRVDLAGRVEATL